MLTAGLRPSQQRHAALFRRAYAAMSAGGDLDDLDDLLAADFVDHAPLPPGTPPDRWGVKQFLASYRAAFPDLQFHIEKYLEQDDTGCAVLRVTGDDLGMLAQLGVVQLPDEQPVVPGQQQTSSELPADADV